MEAAVFGPEEEPDCCKHEGCSDEGEQREDTFVVDVLGVEGSAAGLVFGVWGCGVTGQEEGMGFEGRERSGRAAMKKGEWCHCVRGMREWL